jgi:S-formylglutathione hydrolase FrmB
MGKYLYWILLLFSCSPNPGNSNTTPIQKKEQVKLSLQGLKEDIIAGVAVTLIQDFDSSVDVLGNILVLPGWDFERHRWLTETGLRALAKEKHWRLILPEMHRSVYAPKYYPETTNAAANEKTGTWLTDTFIPAVQAKYEILTSLEQNFVMGLSTGGRGAVYCLWKRPDLFSAAATLSGDFDPTLTPSDRLMTDVFGGYSRFKSRWGNDANLLAMAPEIKKPLYIAHGYEDQVVSATQSKVLFAALKSNNKKTELHLRAGAKHDFKFWDGEVNAVLYYFSSLAKSLKE